MSRPDLSQATEEEVTALFDEDGDLREPQQSEDDEEGTSESTEEDTGEEETDSTEQESEDEEDESEGEIDWETVDERIRQAYESTQKEAQKWKEDYGKIQSKWTKFSQSQKQEEATLNQLRQKAGQLEQWESLLGQNPKLAELVQAELNRQHAPTNFEVPDYLKNDPAFQFVQSQVTPVIQGLQQEINALRQKAAKIDEWDRREVETKNRQHLDGLLNEAKGQIKSLFGREASEEEVRGVLEYMVDNKFYGKNAGKAAVMALYQDQYEKAVRQKYDNELKEKAKKFPPRNKTVNHNRAAQSKDAMSPEEAIAMALAEQGIN